MNTATLNNLACLVARILFSPLFIISGWGKIMAYEHTQSYMAAAGVPGILLPLVILTEVGGGLLILFGFQTRIFSFLLAGFSVLTALFFHSNGTQETEFLKNISLAGGFCALFVSGGGRYSLDAIFAERQPKI